MPVPTTQTGITQLELIKNLPAKTSLDPADLHLIQTLTKSYKLSQLDLAANLVGDNTLIANNGKLGVNEIPTSKISNIDTNKVLGRTTNGNGAIEQLDLDKMTLGDQNDHVASSFAIKDYVDTADTTLDNKIDGVDGRVTTLESSSGGKIGYFSFSGPLIYTSPTKYINLINQAYTIFNDTSFYTINPFNRINLESGVYNLEFTTLSSLGTIKIYINSTLIHRNYQGHLNYKKYIHYFKSDNPFTLTIDASNLVGSESIAIALAKI